MTALFCLQDQTGTAALITLSAPTPHAIAVGDTGLYNGVANVGAIDGGTIPTTLDLPFTVGQVLDTSHFGVTTVNSNLADWPQDGTVTWLTGANSTSPNTSTALSIVGANAYINAAYFEAYHDTRGHLYPASPVSAIEAAIVNATDYIDQRYRFKGVKLLQTLGNPGLSLDIGFIMPWMYPTYFGQTPFMTPASSSQSTAWPRQGVIDYNGDTLYGIPQVIRDACAELAYRALNGTVLQPDYDSTVVRNGAVVESYSEEVGPIRVTTSFDTKLGLGFFPSFPQVDRMLSRGGVLLAGGGRRIIR